MLVVEDEETILTLMSDVLRLEGYDVRAAREGREALAILHDWRPDVILLDLMMPGMNAQDFRTEQDARGFARIPVIVISGARDAVDAGQRLGAVAVIPKPFDLDELLETVQRFTSNDTGSSK